MLHLVGFFFTNCTMMHGSMNVKLKKITSFLLFISYIPKSLIFKISNTIKTKLCYPLYSLCFCNSLWAQVILNVSCKKKH
jgi:hypothetical protein